MLKAIDPRNGKVIREVEPDSQAVVDRKLDVSAAAYKTWSRTTFAERADVLRKVAKRMRERVEELAPLMTEEMGKPIKEARGEVLKAAWCAEHYAEHAEAYLATETIESDATRSYVKYVPLGPILGILPWNAPFWLAFRYCAPTLMAGNTCLMKHDPHVPACANAIAGLFSEAGAPEGIMENLALETKDVERVLRDDRVQAVSFTGSERGGGAVASIAASEIKHSVLELGGSDPAIVLADADLVHAADMIAFMRIINAGQSCIAAKRIIVEDSIYDEMVNLIKERLEKLKVGDPADESTDIGPIARADLRDELHRQVKSTVEQGAKCLLGGEMPEGAGYYYPVTLLTEVTEEMTACKEETFGPVAAMLRASDADDALRIANNTKYGLAASVWTSTERGEQLANEIEAGQVAVNGLVKTDPRLPSGGIKRSGFGRELGPHGIKEFVNAKQIWIGPKRD